MTIIGNQKGEMTMSLNAYADLIADGESLLSAYAMNPDLLPGGEIARDKLEFALSGLKATKAAQEDFAGHRQASTQRLLDAAELTREAARCFRGFVKSVLGTKNEHLVRFGIAPIRPRRNRVPNPKPPAPEAPKPAEQVAGQPAEPDAEKVA
jgi:hypothetical protein